MSIRQLITGSLGLMLASVLVFGAEPVRKTSEPPVIHSSWDDLLEGVKSPAEWQARKEVLRKRYLDLLRDDQKPAKPPLDLQVLESVPVPDGKYTRQMVSYAVEADERTYAYIAIPDGLKAPAPAVVVLHGTYKEANKGVAGLVPGYEFPSLDDLARRGYVVIAPEHFVIGHRTPKEGDYDTAQFYKKHPAWTAVGKFTYEHSIAVDVLSQMKEVDPQRIGAMGHSLGGHGSFFLAAYDPRIQATCSNCSASFFRHNPRPDHWARDHWYIYFKHIRPEMLQGRLPPIDFHEIIALIAPRPFLDVSGLNDGPPLTQRQRVLMNLKIMDVYELEGKPENFAFYVHGQKHSAQSDSRQLIYAWLDKHLKSKPEAKSP
ncbi:MAG: dienelactone hydrolase family protein [Planctomycetales bacterium]